MQSKEEGEEIVTNEKRGEKVIVKQSVVRMLTNGRTIPLKRISIILGLVPRSIFW